MELIGILLPALISLINKKVKDSDLRFWISVLVCAVVGVVLTYIRTLFVFPDIQTGFETISASVLTLIGLTKLSYETVFKEDSLVKKVIEK